MKIKTFNVIVPVFDGVEDSELDNVVNKWIKDNDPIVTDIKYSISGNKHYGAVGAVLITYKEKKKKNNK